MMSVAMLAMAPVALVTKAQPSVLPEMVAGACMSSPAP